MMRDIKETAIPQMDASEDGVNQCHFFLFSVRESHGAALPSTCLYNGNIPMQFLAFSLLIHVLRFLLCSGLPVPFATPHPKRSRHELLSLELGLHRPGDVRPTRRRTPSPPYSTGSRFGAALT